MKLKHLFLTFFVMGTLVGCGTKVNVKVYEEFELTSESYAFAVKKGNIELKNKVDTKLNEMKNDGSIEKLINSYFDGKAKFTYKNPSVNVPKAGDNNYFVVGTNAYFPPFESISGSSFTGIDIEIASKLASYLNKTLYVIDMDFDALIPSLGIDTCDIVMAGMTVNDERLKKVDFCEEYYESAQVLITREDNELFKNCQSSEDIENVLSSLDKSFTVGAQNGTTGYMYSYGNEDFEYPGFKNITTKGYTVGALAVKDLQNGLIDAVIIDKEPAIMIAKKFNK